jgi:hypothetical protein
MIPSSYAFVWHTQETCESQIKAEQTAAKGARLDPAGIGNGSLLFKGRGPGVCRYVLHTRVLCIFAETSSFLAYAE